MIIALTGTPGTGKTSVAEVLGRDLDANIVSLSGLVKVKKMKSDWDKARKINVVDAREIRKSVDREVKKSSLNIIDGHLSHLADANVVVVLRCRPDILIKRMKKKGFDARKINENVQAEILDVITVEAMQENNIIEIDTTKKTAKQTAMLIKKVLNSHAMQRRYSASRIDWTKKFSRYLIDYPANG